MVVRAIVVQLRADVSNYVQNMVNAANATGNAISRHQQSISQISNGLGVVGAAMTGVAVLAVKKFAEFDQAMSNVAATGDDARGSLENLRKAALDAGASTVFSATEAANAVENLAKAGVSAEDILGGGLAGSLDLAAAGSLEVADAAEIAATAMTQFKLEGDDMTHVADLLAAGAGKAQGDVTDMAQALKQSGLVASQFGLSIEETVGTLTAFASAGLLGSDAGTSFRTMLLRMGNPSKESARLMDELGISAYDAGGKFVGMANLSEQLKTKLEGKTQAERDAALATMFGSDAIRAANVMMTEGAAGIDAWIAKVNDQGYAAEVAEIKLDNLSGDLEKLSGAFETALIGLGEGGNDPLRELVQGATKAVDAFGEMPKSTQEATLALVGGGGLVLLGIAGLGKLVIAVNEVRAAVVSLAAVGRVAAVAGALGTIAGYAVGIGATAASVGLLQEKLKTGDAVQSADELALAVHNLAFSGDIDDIAGSFSNFGSIAGVAVTDVHDLGSALDTVLDKSVTDNISTFVDNMWGVTGNIEVVEDRFKSLDTALAELTTSGHGDRAEKAFKAITDEAEKQGYSVEELATLFPEYTDAMGDAKDEAEATAEVQAELEAATAETTVQVVDQTQALLDMVEATSKAAGDALSLDAAQAGLEAAYDDATAALEENGETLDITTEAGRANRDALRDIASNAWDVVDSMAATGASQEDMQHSMEDARAKFVETADAMGLSTEEAEALADQLGLIPTNIPITLPVTTPGLAAAQAGIDNFIRNNNGRVIGVVVQTSSSVKPGTGTASRDPLVFADGGQVTGPGGPRSDNVPALLSPGEWVMNAAAVSKYGHGFMANLNARRYADGGQVSGWSQAPPAGPAGYAMPASMVTMDGARLTGSLDLGNGLVGVIDARVAQGIASVARAQAATRTTTGRVR